MILKHKKTQILFFAISFFCFIFILLFGLRNNVKDLNKEFLQELFTEQDEIEKIRNNNENYLNKRLLI